MKEKVSLFLNPRPWHKVLRGPWGLYIHMSRLCVHLCVCVSMWYAHDCMSFVCAHVQAFVHMFSHVWLYTCKCLYAHVGVSVCVHIFWRPWEPSLKVVEISNLGAGFWLCLQVAGSASRSLSTSLGLWQFLEAGLPWNLGSGKLFLERASCSVFYSLQGTHSFCWISFFFFPSTFQNCKKAYWAQASQKEKETWSGWKTLQVTPFSSSRAGFPHPANWLLSRQTFHCPGEFVEGWSCPSKWSTQAGGNMALIQGCPTSVPGGSIGF